jgi:SAM-dependent methyltransferase
MPIKHRFNICRICSSTSVHRKSSNRKSDSTICRKCGHLFSPPTTFDSFSINTEQEQYFNDGFAHKKDQFTKLYEKFNYRKLKKEIPGGEKYKILEIGPGRGFVLNYLEKMDGHQVCGLDISAEVIKHIRERFGINVMKGDLGQGIKLLNSSYDFIIVRHCLEHFLDPIYVLTQLRKALRQNGKLYIAVPNFSSIHRHLEGWSGYQPYHYQYFTIKSLKTALQKSGLGVRRLYTHESITGWMNTIFRSVKKHYLDDPQIDGPDLRPERSLYMLEYLRLLLGLVITPARILLGHMKQGDELIAVAEVI